MAKIKLKNVTSLPASSCLRATGKERKRVCSICTSNMVPSVDLEEENVRANTEAANELRESIVSAFEAVFSCGEGAGGEGGAFPALLQYREPVSRACLAWLEFDPNYEYAPEEGSEEGSGMEAEGRACYGRVLSAVSTAGY